MEQNARSLILAQRIVAWHNRHPLARRITREQVTGVGTVALPFVGPARKADAGNERDSASGPASSLAASHAAQEAHLSAVEAELAASLGAADEAAFLAAALGTPPDQPAQTSTPQAPTETRSPPESPAAPVAPAARYYPPWHPLVWWSRLRARLARGAAPVQRDRRARGPRKADWAIPVFSENFATPLEASAVARWSRHHARIESPDPDGEGPLREVPVDSGLRRVAMRGRRAALHTRYVSSAAIEWPDQRLRCLVGAASRPGAMPPILGPRVWEPLRVGLAALLAVVVVGGALALWQLRAGRQAAAAEPGPAVSEALAASAAPGASGASDAEAAASAAPAASELPPASAPDHAASEPAQAGSAASAHTMASGAGPAASSVASPNESPAGAASAASAGASGLSPTASAPADVPITRGDPRQGLQPALSEEERHQAREASAAAREAWEAAEAAKRERQARRNDPDRQPVPGIKAGAPTYALVMMPSPQREMADVQLARLKSAATLMAYNGKMRFEVIESGGVFRATWYPFVDRKAAERTLVLLKGRGLAVELVEF